LIRLTRCVMNKNETFAKKRSGFRQKTAFFNSRFAALCRDAATVENFAASGEFQPSNPL
jgi:hypothetical protein